MDIRPGTEDDLPAVRAFLDRHHTRMCARSGELVDALEHPALVAEEDGKLLGVLTFIVGADGCEVLTIHVDQRLRGVGSELMRAVEAVAASDGCRRLFLTTTNDNLDALRFYQRRGFRLVEVLRGAVDDSRARLKPEIPAVGDYGIPLHDELRLEKEIVAARS